MKIRDAGVQGKELLGSSSSFEAQLLPLVLAGWSMRLFHEVVTVGRRNDLNVLHGVEHRKLAQGRPVPVAPQLVGVNDLWDVIFPQQVDEKGPGGPGVSVFLKQDVQHGSVLIHRPPEPMFDPTDLDADLVEMPPRTPPGFAVAQFFGEERRKLDIPLPQGFVADLDAALVEQLLYITLAEGEAVVEPEGVADDAQGMSPKASEIASMSSNPRWAASRSRRSIPSTMRPWVARFSSSCPLALRWAMLRRSCSIMGR